MVMAQTEAWREQLQPTTTLPTLRPFFKPNIYTAMLIYMGLCKCISSCFTLPSCKCKQLHLHVSIVIVIVKKIHVNVNDLHLCGLYVPYIQLHTLTCTTLVFSHVHS